MRPQMHLSDTALTLGNLTSRITPTTQHCTVLLLIDSKTQQIKIIKFLLNPTLAIAEYDGGVPKGILRIID